jgi:protein-S-isoprenylcysteine O-methyltransferase Ste14
MTDKDASNRRVARRTRTLTAGGLFLMVIVFGAYQVFERLDGGQGRLVDLVRLAGITLLALVLSIRSTTSLSFLRRDPMLDDELTRENRLRAGRIGFWAMMLATIACGALSMFVAVTLMEALITILFAGAFAATLRFVRLERRGADGA